MGTQVRKPQGLRNKHHGDLGTKTMGTQERILWEPRYEYYGNLEYYGNPGTNITGTVRNGTILDMLRLRRQNAIMLQMRPQKPTFHITAC
jgi:hypothetical protein